MTGGGVLAVTLPACADTTALRRRVRSAEAAGADLLLLAEPPFGPWAGARTALSFLRAATALGVGALLDTGGVPPLRTVEDLSVLQRAVGRDAWFVLGCATPGGSPQAVAAMLCDGLDGSGRPITPTPHPLATPVWAVAEDPSAARDAAGLFGRRVLVRCPGGWSGPRVRVLDFARRGAEGLAATIAARHPGPRDAPWLPRATALLESMPIPDEKSGP